MRDEKAKPRDDKRPRRRGSRSAAALFILAVYVLSSGPVIAAGFWLRQATKWEGFYGVMWLYAPLLMFGRFEPVDAYISWWVKLFGTVGPG